MTNTATHSPARRRRRDPSKGLGATQRHVLITLQDGDAHPANDWGAWWPVRPEAAYGALQRLAMRGLVDRRYSFNEMTYFLTPEGQAVADGIVKDLVEHRLRRDSVTTQSDSGPLPDPGVVVRSAVHMADKQTLGDLIKNRRVELDIKLRELARRLDVTPSYVSDIEYDRRVPSEDVLGRIATELQLDRDDLVARSGRIGTEAERYLRETPAATTLFRRVAERKLDDDQLRDLMKQVEDMSPEDDQGR